MGLLNFKKQFVAKIQCGEKRHTIRAKRKRAWKVSEKLHLYTGLRQKGAQLIFRTKCTRVQEVEIGQWRVWIDGVALDTDELDSLAVSDGFADFDDMMAFWKGRLPFKGDMIHWKFPTEVQP